MLMFPQLARILFSAALLAGLWGTSVRADPFVTFTGPTMGTAYRVSIARPDAQVTIDQHQQSVAAYLSEFDRCVSTYRDDSEIARFNAARHTEWIAVSAETARLVQQALDLARRTRGAFDPTVAPLVRLWGFDHHQGRKSPPTDAEVAAALARVGYQHLAVRETPPAIRKALPELELDLNGIAPGFAVDRLVEQLAQRGCVHVLVDIGGEIRTRGRKADGSSWRIGIERPAGGDPGSARRMLQAALPLDDAAVATSGDYRNFYVLDGQRYAHTIDPRTGRPARHALASATVIAAEAAEADGLATALMVLGPDDGLLLAENLGVAAWLVIREADERFTTRSSTAFSAGPGRALEDLAGADRPQ